MKTAEEYRIKIFDKIEPLIDMSLPPMIFMPKLSEFSDFVENQITERDKEWTQKIQTAKDKTSNWNCKEVLTKLLEDK